MYLTDVLLRRGCLVLPSYSHDILDYVLVNLSSYLPALIFSCECCVKKKKKNPLWSLVKPISHRCRAWRQRGDWGGTEMPPSLRSVCPSVCLPPLWAGHRQAKARHDGTSLLCCCCHLALPGLLTTTTTQAGHHSPVTLRVSLPPCFPACFCLS